MKLNTRIVAFVPQEQQRAAALGGKCFIFFACFTEVKRPNQSAVLKQQVICKTFWLPGFPELKSLLHFEGKVVQRGGIDGIAIERQRQAQHAFVLGNMMPLRLGDFCGHAFQRPYAHHGVNVAVPLFMQRRANGEHRFALERGVHSKARLPPTPRRS